MKKLLKKIYLGLGNLNATIVSIVSIILFSLKRTNTFFRLLRQHRKDSEFCTILGNGSSLNSFLETKPEKIENVMVVNFFANTDHFWTLKPDMYIVLDNILIGTANRSYNKEKVETLYKNLQSVDWPLIFYFPSNGNMQIIKKLKENKNITVVIYNMTPISGIKSICHWMFRNSLGMPYPNNISNAAVFCALNSGYKKIYLYGVEHSWLKSFDVDPETHRIYMNDGHFYKKEDIRWFKRGDYCNWLKDVQRALQSHFELRDYADSIGAKIINKTPTSFIEAYEFDEY